MNEYFEKINGDKYLTLLPTNESKKKNILRIWSEIRDLIRSITKSSDGYDEKSMKMRFNSDDELPLNKMKEIPTMIIAFRAVFHENDK